MIVRGVYSFNSGKEVLEARYAVELREVEQIIAQVDSSRYKTKTSHEKTMLGRTLYSPRALNKAFKREFEARDWQKSKVRCEYPTEYYVAGYVSNTSSRGAFREMDFVKNRIGVEVQFGKYAFMVYNVCAKMTIFHKMSVIDVGIEIVPLKDFADEMSTGVSYFEQFVWDLERRGVADIDIPVLILGVTAKSAQKGVHPMSEAVDIRASIQAYLNEKEQLPCEAAHCIAGELSVDPLSVGDQATASDIRITRCQLGFFGYAEKKGLPGYKIVRQLERVPEAAAAAVRQASSDGAISCAALWQIGEAQGLSKSDMGNVAETLGIKVRPCQLGCF